MFDIRNSADFYRKCLDDYSSLLFNPSYAGFAINCAMSSYHLAEWIWGDWLKTDHVLKARLKVKSCDDFKGWVEAQCPFFKTVQSIANGSKHFNRNVSGNTAKMEGVAEDEGFERDHLVVLTDDNTMRSIEDMIQVLLTFWHDFLEEHSIYKDLKSPDEVGNES
ncbi:hypothetical protein [Bradyrhizobium sp. dw_411]|uniref:hypothetical protein n=1 Tax=Bradyrhizobium sp. dw_411 TaxID=2720082 RepID=UPI001BCC15A8|nr:hypothetical protein [Bradyrhizobium sp. dw_411]